MRMSNEVVIKKKDHKRYIIKRLIAIFIILSFKTSTFAEDKNDTNQFIGKTYWVAERFREFISGKSVSQPSLSFVVEEVNDSEKGKTLKVRQSTDEIEYIFLDTFLSSLNKKTSVSPPDCHFPLRAFSIFIIDPVPVEKNCKQEAEKLNKEIEKKKWGEIEKKWGKKVLKAIKAKEIYIGMTVEQVKLSWGLPKHINRSVGAWGVHEQWVYENTYLYFENEILTSFQD